MSEQFYASMLQNKRRPGQRMKATQRIKAQAQFLAAYERTANILQAAEQAEIARTLVYYWQEHDEQFGFAFNLADKAANTHIEAEIKRRGIEGWEEPLVSAGKRMGTVRKYSDVLLMFYAKRRMPEYREKSQVDVNATAGSPQAIADAINEAIADALAPYPEARIAVAAAMAAKGKAS